MQAYNEAFAKIYNMLWHEFARSIAPRIREFYESASGERVNIFLLDVCCGVGHLAQHFLENGYDVTGLDASPAMLHYAQENTQSYIDQGRARYVEGDAADFTLDRRFGLAVSTFDALNHLPDMDALRGCFRSVFAVLSGDGWFIFDLNTRRGLEHWGGISVVERDDLVLMTRGVVIEGPSRAYTRISGFLKLADSGLYERFEQTTYNTLFDLVEVRASLLDAGFRSVHFASANNLVASLNAPEEEPRVFIVARK